MSHKPKALKKAEIFFLLTMGISLAYIGTKAMLTKYKYPLSAQSLLICLFLILPAALLGLIRKEAACKNGDWFVITAFFLILITILWVIPYYQNQ